MKRCDAKVELGRRQFLRGGAVAAAGAVATTVMPSGAGAQQKTQPASARVEYPTSKLGNVSQLKPNTAFDVAYPDKDSPGVLLKLGKRVSGGVGADGDIVGFSTLCPHKGFPLNFRADDKSLNCPGHYSRFDCENGGQQIHGQATQNLPQFMLRVEANGDIVADGVDELIYGRLSNVL